MKEREAFQDSEELSVASDEISIDVRTPQSEDVTLSWRNDPAYNFSDWKIQIKVRNDPSKKEREQYCLAFVSKTYHVHRNILAIGERRSAYFANLFHYGIDDGGSCTCIEISSGAAAHFPDLLDYLYSSSAFTVTTANAIALLFLSQAFQVSSLETTIESFITKDIKLRNVGHYLSDALYFGDESVAIKVIDKCEKEAMALLNDSPSLTKIMSAPISSSMIKVGIQCRTLWAFLTEKRSLLVEIFPKLQRRKDHNFIQKEV